MGQEVRHFRLAYREGIFTAISVGFFFILVGAIFAATSSLYDGLRTFFSSDSWMTDKVGNTNVFIPVPVNPSAHSAVYQAAFEFCLIWGFFQVFLLIFRFVVGSRPRRKARTASSVAFWLGASYLINTYLNATTTKETWYTFWAAILILIGISLIIRAVVRSALKCQVSISRNQ